MFLDLSLPEIAVLLGLGVLLFGPDKLPHAAAKAARFLQQVRELADTNREALRRELGPEFDGLSLEDLNPRTFLRNQLEPETAQLRALAAEVDRDLRAPSAAPASPASPAYDHDAT